ncbi:MAG: SDR family oxidoreductase [Planctomycetaceae bacterium]|nr:SDR family oxidoreductase [Planctomycetaceae bacterium]
MTAPRQTVLVSGGSRGLGAALVASLLADGWQVATCSREPSAATAKLHEQYGEQFLWQRADAAQADSLRSVVSAMRERWSQIDALVNNAAIAREGMFTLQSEQDIEQSLAVNLAGVLHLTRACARAMLTQGRGSIINISSVNALRGHAGVAVYSATKAALDGATRSLARELGPSGIRVNSVAPGYFASELTADMSDQQRQRIVRRTPLGRLATIDDIVGVIRFLLSPAASFMTGQTLVVDGGLTC